jgi:hypothetical protein
VQQQAAMRAFLDIFTLVTVVFLLMIPLLLLMRKPKKDEGGSSKGSDNISVAH